MGHYVACLRYNVIATRPYFLPVPLSADGHAWRIHPHQVAHPDKIALFDIGIAGPIAGFVIAVPALFSGLMLSRVDRLPEDTRRSIELGEPLLFQFAAWLDLGRRRRRLFAQHAPDGVRGVVRPAGDRAEPVSHRAARRRPHLLRGARPPVDDGHARHDRRRDRPDVRVVELDRLDAPDDRDDLHVGPASSADPRRRSAAGSRAHGARGRSRW